MMVELSLTVGDFRGNPRATTMTITAEGRQVVEHMVAAEVRSHDGI
jgi:hypothetical protein